MIMDGVAYDDLYVLIFSQGSTESRLTVIGDASGYTFFETLWLPDGK
jgi:hypothetical protein